MALRLKYADIDAQIIKNYDEFKTITDEPDTVIIPTYTAMMALRPYLRKNQAKRSFGSETESGTSLSRSVESVRRFRQYSVHKKAVRVERNRLFRNAAHRRARFDFSDYDLIFIGGGQDREQKLVLRDLTVKKRIHCIMRLKTAQSCSPSAAAISCLADFMKLLPATFGVYRYS